MKSRISQALSGFSSILSSILCTKPAVSGAVERAPSRVVRAGFEDAETKVAVCRSAQVPEKRAMIEILPVRRGVVGTGIFRDESVKP